MGTLGRCSSIAAMYARPIWSMSAPPTPSFFSMPQTAVAAVRATVKLERQSAPRGGDRVYLIAPCCGERRAHLALLAEGVRCRKCGSITTYARRHSKARRAVAAAAKLAAALGSHAWYAPPARRPAGMRVSKFMRLSREHEARVGEACALLGRTVDGGAISMAALARV